MKYLIKEKQNLLKRMYIHLQLSGILTVTINVSKRYISCNARRHTYISAFDLAKRSITSCNKALAIASGPPHCRCLRITLRQTQHAQYDSSERLFSPTQRPLPDNTQRSGRDSNPQSQQASGRRPTPLSARILGSALASVYCQIDSLQSAILRGSGTHFSLESVPRGRKKSAAGRSGEQGSHLMTY